MEKVNFLQALRDFFGKGFRCRLEGFDERLFRKVYV